LFLALLLAFSSNGLGLEIMTLAFGVLVQPCVLDLGLDSAGLVNITADDNMEHSIKHLPHYQTLIKPHNSKSHNDKQNHHRHHLTALYSRSLIFSCEFSVMSNSLIGDDIRFFTDTFNSLL